MALNIVRLTQKQAAYAEQVAAMRQESATARGLADRHGFSGDGLAAHRLGAYGEVAVAKWLFKDEPWDLTIDTFRSEPDLPGGIEVRTRSRGFHELIVRKDDEPLAPYVLVTKAGTAWWLRGWIWGREAQREAWLKGHGGREEAYFVPHAALYPMELFGDRESVFTAIP